MDTNKRSTVYKRLIRKFDALRATLPDDEREIFDTIVTPEVEGHRLAGVRKPMKRALKNTAEVQANKLSIRKPMKRALKNASEVEAHKLSIRKPARRQKKAA